MSANMDMESSFSSATEDERLETTGSPIPEEGGGDDDGGGWLTSYADLMTLVACFFILMTSFASFDPVTFQRKAELMAKYFHGENDTAEKPSEIIIESERMAAGEAETESPPQSETMVKMMAELNKISNQGLEVKHNDSGINITMNVTTLFELGSAELTDEAQMLVNQIVSKVMEVDDSVQVAVEGHTDNLPINSAHYPSNWELSSARASSVIREFEKKNFARDRMLAIGVADTKPALPNTDEQGNPILENQLKNRRIVIKVLKPETVEEPISLGTMLNQP